MRRLQRLAFIAWAAWRHGLLAWVMDQSGQWPLKVLARLLSGGQKPNKPSAAHVRLLLESLGPLFVKFGQVLSTRRDLLPTDLAMELAKLQDQVPPFDGREARAVIEQAFGRSIDSIFSVFNDVPVASASIAQVHFANLTRGDEVAVKVLRPGMLEAIEDDLAWLKVAAGWIERIWLDGRRLRPREVVREFDHHLHDELDLVKEAANAMQLRRNMEGLDLVQVPIMNLDLCARDVLVMQRMHGVPISQIDTLKAHGVDLPKLARDGVTIFFTQVFRDGFFHADMHPGNIQVSVDPRSLGRYIALDFGIVGTLSEVDKNYLAQNFMAFFRRDYRRVAQLHLDSGWVPPQTRVDELESAVRAVCEPYFARPLKDVSLGQVLLRLFQTSRRFNVEIQPQLVLLQKTLLNVEGLGRELDPNLDLWSTAKPFLERWMNEQVGWRALRRHLVDEAPQYAVILPQLPRLLQLALTAQATSNGGQHHRIRRSSDQYQMESLAQMQHRTHRLLVVLLFLVLVCLAGMSGMVAWYLTTHG